MTTSGEALELAHLQGFTGKFRQLVLGSTGSLHTGAVIYTIGSVVVLEDASDTHEQVFLTGHDNDVSALALSPCGTFLASGQMGSMLHVGAAAPVIVWRLSTLADGRMAGTRVYTLTGLTAKVRNLAFSADSKLLVATAGMREAGGAPIVVWEMSAGQVVAAHTIDAPITTVDWVPIESLTERPSVRVIIILRSTHNSILHYFNDIIK